MAFGLFLKVDDGLVTPEQLRQERQGELPSGNFQTYPQMAGQSLLQG